ncbi:hypothetical protein T4D_14479 [Trichinella pseudospiralis]|uniref:Uncharacterized protein n=1 Tax=Trichinella pseudospiralis TaxID=6337 RepID=A0A0V1DNV9_TRIPS|nr:hypothetical protein T4D_14479 [Trichinella pseudospiralis]
MIVTLNVATSLPYESSSIKWQFLLSKFLKEAL